MEIQGQGHYENRDKSKQVIYRSGPSIILKMKEIREVVRKLSREQKSAAGGTNGGVRTGTNHKVTSVYRGIPGWLINK